jgi:hypothetical protein
VVNGRSSAARRVRVNFELSFSVQTLNCECRNARMSVGVCFEDIICLIHIYLNLLSSYTCVISVDY